MKTKSILCLLFVCFSTGLFAQETESSQTIVVEQSTTTTPVEKKPMFWMGPKFGTFASSTTKKFDEIKSKLKEYYQVGILAQYGRTLYIQPEVYYCSFKNVPDLNRVKVPVMLGLRFLNLGLFSLHVMGGPQYTMCLNDNYKSENGFNWQVGAGIDILGFITTDIRYDLQKDVSLDDQIKQFTSTPTIPTILTLTVGLKLI